MSAMQELNDYLSEVEIVGYINLDDLKNKDILLEGLQKRFYDRVISWAGWNRIKVDGVESRYECSVIVPYHLSLERAIYIVAEAIIDCLEKEHNYLS